MSNKIIFTKIWGDNLFAFKYINDKIFSIEHCESDSIVGTIYVGVVADILKNIDAAFVGFDKGLKGYYLINDNTPIFLNHKNCDKLCQGDRILVQVLSDKVKSKEYSLTSNITFTGKYVVLTVGRTGISISKKIKNNDFRKELKNAFAQFTNEEYGFILRTSCTEENISNAMAESREMAEYWKELKEKATHLTAGSVVKKNPGDVIRIALEACNKRFDEIVTDEQNVYEELISNEQISSNNIVRFYNDKTFSLKKAYSLEKLMKDSFDKRVWLDSGAYLVIEHTEALHVIDVNTGKVNKKGNREDIFCKINLEAARAIAVEIRKRNLSGIIIVDFINMKEEENKNKLIDEMKNLLSADDITTTVSGFTNLGLMEITRKRIKKPLHELGISMT